MKLLSYESTCKDSQIFHSELNYHPDLVIIFVMTNRFFLMPWIMERTLLACYDWWGCRTAPARKLRPNLGHHVYILGRVFGNADPVWAALRKGRASTSGSAISLWEHCEGLFIHQYVHPLVITRGTTHRLHNLKRDYFFLSRASKWRFPACWADSSFPDWALNKQTFSVCTCFNFSERQESM